MSISAIRLARIAILIWGAIFVVLTLAFTSGAELGYSGGEWTIGLGLPPWLWVGGDGGYPGLISGIWEGAWNWSLSYMAIALAIAWLPVGVSLCIYWYVNRRLRYHLSTAIILVPVCSTLLWANVRDVQVRGIGGLGWPVASWTVPYPSLTLLADVSVAFTIIFFVALLLERLFPGTK